MKEAKTAKKQAPPYERHYSILQNIAYYFRFYRKTMPVFLWIALVEILVGAAVPYIRIYLPKFAIDLVTAAAGREQLIWKLGGLGILYVLFQALYQSVSEGKYSVYNERRSELLSSLFLKSLRVPYRDTEKGEIRELYQKALETVIMGDNSSLYRITYGTLDIIKNIISFVLYSTVLGVLSPVVTVLLLILSLVQYVLSFSRIKYLERFRALDADIGRRRRYLSNSMGNTRAAKEIRIFGMREWLNHLLDKVFAEMKKLEKRKSRSENVYVQINGALTVLRDAGAYAYLIWQVFQGNIEAGDFVLYFGAVTGFSGFVESIIRNVGMLRQGSNDLNYYRAYLELPEESLENIFSGDRTAGLESVERGLLDHPVKQISGKRISGNRFSQREEIGSNAVPKRHISELTLPVEITFEDVSFSYSDLESAADGAGVSVQDRPKTSGRKPVSASDPDSDGNADSVKALDSAGNTGPANGIIGDDDDSGQIFRHFNLTIRGGEKVALVGINGAGKTTFVKLLCGIYEPWEGRILFNGIDRREFPRKEVYRLFSAVFQEKFLPPFTIGESLSLQAEWDREKAWKALEDAGLKESFTERGITPDSYYGKDMDEEGVELSGGQEQRFLLARALYKDAPVLVLDEPAAALDPIAESEIYDSYLKFSEKKTAVFISHRLASTRFSDRILLLDGGKVVEEGTHEELMAKGQKYAEMFQVQSSYYAKSVREKEAFS